MPNLPKSDAIASTKGKGKGKGKGKAKSRLATTSTKANANAAERTAVDATQTAAETEETKDFTHAYAEDLRADIYTDVNANPKAKVHTVEWNKIMIGDPVEINPSVGAGMKIMTVDEWISRWKQNERFPDCLSCGSTNTKEHHFSQSWCRGKKKFESETICADCHMWSWRSYADPDFLTPEEYDKLRWEKLVAEHAAQINDERVTDETDAVEPEAIAA